MINVENNESVNVEESEPPVVEAENSLLPESKKVFENRRAELRDENSAGYQLVQNLREQKNANSTAESQSSSGKKKKKKTSKAIATNLRLKNNDLAVLDAFAECFAVSRSHLLETLVSHDVDQMFQGLRPTDQYEIAKTVDNAIEEKGFENEYRGRTWYWDSVEPANRDVMGHPDYDRSIINRKKGETA